MLPVIEKATAYLREAGVAPSRFWAYVLVQDVADAHRRVLALEKMGVTSFAQPYRVRVDAVIRWGGLHLGRQAGIVLVAGSQVSHDMAHGWEVGT